MNNKMKIIILFCAVELLLAVNCRSQIRAGNQKVKAKWNKDSTNIKLSIAQEQFDSGQYEQAEETAKQCLTTDPNMAQAKLLLGKVKFAKEDFDGAKHYLQDYIYSNYKDDASLFLLGVANERLGDNSSAMGWYKRAMEISPENTDYIIAVGQMYQAAGDFNSAETLYTGKMESNPSNTDLKVAAAQMYLSQDKNEKALELYEQASMLKPDNNKLLESLGSCYILMNQWDKALEIHRQLYAGSSNKEDKNRYLKAMAVAAISSSNYSDALKYYTELVSQDKRDAQLWFSMGQAALGAGSLKQAIVCSQKVLEISPDMKEAWLLSGSVNYKNGNYMQAIEDYQKAANDTQCKEFAWRMISRCYVVLGKTEQANIAYQKSVRSGTDDELGQLIAGPNGEEK
jgi:tetratricopeptide (TPR) repeat protein